MNDKKYQIFISSTFADLKDERLAAMNSIINLRHIPIGMEGFPAIDQEQMSYIKRLIDECDYYVLIIANRYGSVGPDGLSFTEQEYDYAVSKGKHVLAFINNAGDELDCDAPEPLTAFKRKVSTGRIIKHWDNKSPLELAVYKSLGEAFDADPRVGWVRGDAAIDAKVFHDLEQARAKIAELELISRSITLPNNIAGLDHNIVIPFTFKKYVSGTGYPAADSINLSLRDIFTAIAQNFRVWKTEGSLALTLKTYLRRSERDFAIATPVSVLLLNQFELLGLMRSTVMQSTSGPSYVYYQLTNIGESLLKDGLAIRA
jgi:hypothetical protein